MSLFEANKDQNHRRKVRRKSTMEFDFIGGIPSPRARRSGGRRTAGPAHDEEAATPRTDQIIPPMHDSGPAPTADIAATHVVHNGSSTPDIDFSTAKQQEERPSTMNPSTSQPSPINAAGSIRRQTREQRSVNSLLHGVGLALVCGILVVASLAGLGGYVLYQQMQDQSASLALLEINMKKRLYEMETELVARNRELARNLEQTNLRLTGLTAQFDEHRSESNRSIAELRASGRALERSITLYQQRTREQQELITQLQSQNRLRR